MQRALNLNNLDALRENERFRPLVGLLERVGQSDEHVIVSGSPGIDKELVARFIHAMSPRRACPFVTYAVSRKTMRSASSPDQSESVERAWLDATGGTLYIVELYDLTDGDQAQLLRFLELRDSPYPAAPRRAPVRVVAAARGDPAVCPHPEHFRSSLFHRLNVMSVYVPPEAASTVDPEEERSHLSFKEEKMRLLEEWEPEYLRELLWQVGGNLALAARTAGIARAHLYRLMKKHRLAR